MFSISFYIFSFLLSYTDCTRYKIPNITIATSLLFLLIFGWFEGKLEFISFILSFAILIFFIILLIIMPKMILGGGDIKYMMLIAIYIQPILFPLFLLSTGIVQIFFLIYFQQIKKRRVAPMAPAMFLAVIVTELLFYLGVYPF